MIHLLYGLIAANCARHNAHVGEMMFWKSNSLNGDSELLERVEEIRLSYQRRMRRMVPCLFHNPFVFISFVKRMNF